MNLDRAAQLQLLSWYHHSGIDIALEDAPINRFEEFNRLKEIKPSPPKTVPGKTFPAKNPDRSSGTSTNSTMPDVQIPDENAIANARELADSATSLQHLRELMVQFTGCNLRLGAKNLVFGDGNPQADIMFIGEAPGREEDMHGLPFIGRSGQLLERMLAAINLSREQVYISNVIPWRPPGNRTPTPAEAEICRPFIERHIALVSPRILVLLGGAPSKTLLNTNEGILRMRGNWRKYIATSTEIDAMPTLHPAYLLRQPAQKKLAWQDLQKIKSRLQNT